MIRYGFCERGGFWVIDDDRRRASYAYPTSPHANEAKKHNGSGALTTANKMADDFANRSDSAIEEDHYQRICMIAERGKP